MNIPQRGFTQSGYSLSSFENKTIGTKKHSQQNMVKDWE